MNNWNVGIYIRLSQEDGDKEESNSVVNQRELINNYIAEEKDLKIYDYYIDDGWSGTNFNRPDFIRMIKDVEAGIINTIIVKDLSRFGRNYIEVGNYLEQIFPINNIRFISINDCIDSYQNPESINSIIVPFKNLMNDEYCRDISQKVKYALNTRKRNGEYMASFAPYGYIKSSEDKHKLEVDEEAAKVVKRIFALAVKGIGTTTIAKTLNKEDIPSPGRYKKDVQKLNCYFRSNGKKSVWSDSNVSTILRNRVYLGEMVQCKYRNISYKIHKRVKNQKEDLIIVKDTHKALVSEKDFNKVKAYLDNRGFRCNSDGTVSIFAGKIKCGDCKAAMTRNVSGTLRKDGTRSVNYYCSTYTRKSHDLCTRHSFKLEELEQVVLKIIQKQIELVLDKEELLSEIYKENNNDDIKAEYQNKINKLKEELSNLDVLKKEAYLDWKKEILSQNDYFMFVEEYSNKINAINKEITEYENKIKGVRDDLLDEYISKFKKYQNVNELDREIIEELIEVIYVYENQVLNIVFKYDDLYKKLIKLTKKEVENE